MKKRIVSLITLLFVLCLFTALLTACGKTYYVKFMVDGEEYFSAEIRDNAISDLPAAPQKDGYVFEGWYLDNGSYENPFIADLSSENVTDNLVVYAKFKPIDAHSHNFETEWTTDVAPTCTEEGSKSRHCPGCNEKSDVTAIPALGHNFGAFETVSEATCTTEGLKKRVCSVCEDEDTEIIPALGHNYDTQWTVDVDPTCTAAGSKSRHCSRCSDKTDVTAIPALGHDEINHEAKAATCTENGWAAYVTCSRCGYSTFEPIVAAGHNYGDWVTVTEVTCTTNGLKKRVCSVCEDEDTETITAPGHDYGDWTIVTEVTCTTDGLKKRVCSVCEDEDTETITAPGHDYGDWITVTEVTCTTDGLKKRVCSVCEDEDTET
ncbi:MAG: InlB B-repeat-containing protein, partial [Christensenellales bacterium]